MNKEIDFVYENYPDLKAQLSKKQLVECFYSFPDNVVSVGNNGTIDGVAYYFRLNDDLFEALKEKKISFTNIDDICKCFSSYGLHIHFAFVVTKGINNILKGLRRVIEREKPKTISWCSHSPERLKIFNLRRTYDRENRVMVMET